MALRTGPQLLPCWLSLIVAGAQPSAHLPSLHQSLAHGSGTSSCARQDPTSVSLRRENAPCASEGPWGPSAQGPSAWRDRVLRISAASVGALVGSDLKYSRHVMLAGSQSLPSCSGCRAGGPGTLRQSWAWSGRMLIPIMGESSAHWWRWGPLTRGPGSTRDRSVPSGGTGEPEPDVPGRGHPPPKGHHDACPQWPIDKKVRKGGPPHPSRKPGWAELGVHTCPSVQDPWGYPERPPHCSA